MAGAEHEYVLYQRGEEGDSDAWDDTVLIKAYDDAVSAMKAKLAETHPEFSTTPPRPKSKKKKRNKGKSKKKKSHSDPSNHWSPGDLCRAVYTEDGEVYEARIISIAEDEGKCTVKYMGYGNQEEQPLSNLLPLESAASSQEHRTDTASETESLPQATVTQEINPGRHRSKKSLSSHPQHTQVPRWPWGRNPAVPPPPVFSHMPPPPPQFAPFAAPPFPGFQAAGPCPAPPPTFPCVPPPPPLFPDGAPGEENEALYSMLISWYMSGYHTGYYQGLKQSTTNAASASGFASHR